MSCCRERCHGARYEIHHFPPFGGDREAVCRLLGAHAGLSAGPLAQAKQQCCSGALPSPPQSPSPCAPARAPTEHDPGLVWPPDGANEGPRYQGYAADHARRPQEADHMQCCGSQLQLYRSTSDSSVNSRYRNTVGLLTQQ